MQRLDIGIADIDPHVMLVVFLPALLFESACFGLDIGIFQFDMNLKPEAAWTMSSSTESLVILKGRRSERIRSVISKYNNRSRRLRIWFMRRCCAVC